MCTPARTLTQCTLTVVWGDNDDVAVLSQLLPVVEAELVAVAQHVAPTKDPKLRRGASKAEAALAPFDLEPLCAPSPAG